MRWLKNILLVVLLIAIIVASFWVSFLVGKQMLAPVRKPTLPESDKQMTFEVVTETVISEEATSTVLPEVTKTPLVEKKKTVPKKTVAKKTTVSSVIYKVQAGAFTSYTNAVNLKKKLIAIGYPAIVQKTGGLWKVKVGPYYSYSSARNCAERLTGKGYEAIVRRER